MSVVDISPRHTNGRREEWGHGREQAEAFNGFNGIKEVTMPTQSQPGSGDAPSSFVSACDPAVLWEALVHGSGNRVAVFDSAAKVLYANPMANAEYAHKAGKTSIVGMTLDDYTPASFAAEWRSLMRRVMQEQRPIIVEGMIHGFKYRATFTPVGEGLSGYVLVVSRNVADIPPTDPGVRAGVEVVQAKSNDLGVLEQLTDREMEVLVLIGEGLSTAEVARRLDRSVKTVEWHRAALGNKLGITNRVELARIAIGAGICKPPASKAGRRGAKPAKAASPAKA